MQYAILNKAVLEKTTSSKVQRERKSVYWIQKLLCLHAYAVKFCTTMYSAKVQKFLTWPFPKFILKPMQVKMDIWTKSSNKTANINGKNLPVYN